MTTEDEHRQASIGPSGATPPDAAPDSPPVPSSESLPPAAADPGQPPGGDPAGHGSSNPPGIYPAVFEAPSEPVDAPAPDPRKRGRMAAGIGGAVVVIGALLLKFGLPILVGTAVSGALGGVFGGPFEKLPSDQKQALEQRFEAATGDTLNGMSEAETTTRVTAMQASGLPRLDDELLVERVRLSSTMLNAADVATCARLARATATRGVDEEAMMAALDAIDTASVGRWFEIGVSAIEADAAGAATRAVAEADSARVLGDLTASFSETEVQQLTALYGTTGASDVDACGAIRALYAHMEELPPADLAIAALYDVSP